MKLTQQDMATISRLQKFQAQWRHLRWLVLLAGLLSASLFIFDA